jgi:hypothetical protein
VVHPSLVGRKVGSVKRKSEKERFKVLKSSLLESMKIEICRDRKGL